MNSTEQEEITRLNEQLEVVTQKAREATAEAKLWREKYQQTLWEAPKEGDRTAYLASTIESLQRANVKLEDRIDLLLDVISLISKQEIQDY